MQNEHFSERVNVQEELMMEQTHKAHSLGSLVYPLNNIHPKIGQGVFLAPSAVLGGEIEVGSDSSFWFHSVARGDVAPISIGERTNIQDLTLLHVTDDIPLVIGHEVSVGHSATLHSCKIGDSCLIGMGATVLDEAKIGARSLVAAGSLVPPGKEFPPESFIMGSPAKFIRKLNSDEITTYSHHYKKYLLEKEKYLNDQSFQQYLKKEANL